MSLSSERISLSFRPQQFSGLFSTWTKNCIIYLKYFKKTKHCLGFLLSIHVLPCVDLLLNSIPWLAAVGHLKQ